MSEFLTIALTKGRLAYRTLELLEKEIGRAHV